MFIAKGFDELTREELYEILRARVDVFVVEQHCPYPELDGVDYDSLHVFCVKDGAVAAYLRAFPREGEPGVIQVGRVLTREGFVKASEEFLEDGIPHTAMRLHLEE